MAVEADWPDAYRVNRYVLRPVVRTPTPIDALADFERFPAWMWRNADVLDFVELAAGAQRHASHPASTKAGFYGLDLYSLRASMEAVIALPRAVDPEAARIARASATAASTTSAAKAPSTGTPSRSTSRVPCEDEVVAELVELRRRAAALLARDGWAAEDEFFFAEQNARLVRNAERYYRQMYRGRVSSWNLRDRHMAETLDALCTHLDRQLGRARIVVWEHNSHVGDARATETGGRRRAQRRPARPIALAAPNASSLGSPPITAG